RQSSPRIFTRPGFFGSMASSTSAFSPITASTFDACAFGVKRNLAKGMRTGVNATVETTKTVQGIHAIDVKKAAIEAASAPKATHKKKKCVGGGKISTTMQRAATINQYFEVIGSPLSAEAASRQTTPIP